MKLKNTLLVVKNIEISKKFYKDVFGLMVIADFEGNAVLTEGLVLQDEAIWKSLIERDVIWKGHNTELYFEENDMNGFLERLNNWSEPIEFVTPITELSWGQRVVRLYDPDGHMIEVRESMDYVARKG